MLGEIATFNSSSVENCTINAGAAGANRCDGISIASTYTGTITVTAGLNLHHPSQLDALVQGQYK